MDTIILLKYQFYPSIWGEICCTKTRPILWNRTLDLYELFIENMIVQKTVCLHQVVRTHRRVLSGGSCCPPAQECPGRQTCVALT